MNDPVLSLLTDTLLSHDYHVLRYNSRGVAHSSGSPSFSGLTEGKDLEAVLHWMRKEGGLGLDHLIIIGYSHGSLIASLLPVHENVSYILLSYPLGPRTFLTFFHGSTYDKALKVLLRDADRNVLFIYGTSDQFTALHTYKALRQADDWNNTEFVQVDGGSHFWRGTDGKMLVGHVKRWLSTSQ